MCMSSRLGGLGTCYIWKGGGVRRFLIKNEFRFSNQARERSGLGLKVGWKHGKCIFRDVNLGEQRGCDVGVCE